MSLAVLNTIEDWESLQARARGARGLLVFKFSPT